MTDEQKNLVEIYKAYTSSKEKFIDRNFATNRYYLSLTIFLLLTSAIMYTLTPNYLISAIIGAIGLVVGILWYINLDSYQFLIKIKYANVLEKMEDSLPYKPCQDEFKTTQEIKKKKGIFVFSDLQKGLAFLFTIIFAIIFFTSLGKAIAVNFNPFQAPVTEIHTDLLEFDETK